MGVCRVNNAITDGASTDRRGRRGRPQVTGVASADEAERVPCPASRGPASMGGSVARRAPQARRGSGGGL